jgi:hypothetical protein
MLSAPTILASMAVLFAVLVVFRLVGRRGRWDPASRTWALIAAIFAIVSVIISG